MAITVPSNIAEGDELDTDKQALRHFYFAKGSCAEVLTHAIIAYEIGYIDSDIYQELESLCTELAGMLGKLIVARSRS